MSAYRARGDSYKELGNFQRAIADYDKAIELVPSSFAAHFGRGLVFRDMGDHRRAIDDFNKALTLTKAPTLQVKVEQALAQLQE